MIYGGINIAYLLSVRVCREANVSKQHKAVPHSKIVNSCTGGKTGMRLRLLSLTLALSMLLLSIFAIAPAQPAAAQGGITQTLTNIPLTGTFNGLALPAGTVLNGTLNITQFQNQNGVPTAIGTLSGTVTGLVNGVPTTLATLTNVPVALPLLGANASGACSILDLTLGPIHLDLLGLVVDTNQIHLTITAQPGSGNLLGNLLCAVAHLLDNTNASTNAIVNFLNRIIGSL